MLTMPVDGRLTLLTPKDGSHNWGLFAHFYIYHFTMRANIHDIQFSNDL